MKRRFIFLLLMVPFCVPAMQAQDAEHDSIDVLHYRLTLDMGHNAVKKLHGVAEITFVTTRHCRSVTFDLIADSVSPVSLDGTVTRGFNYSPDDMLLEIYLSGQTGDTHVVSIPYVAKGHVESYGFGGLHMDNGIYYNLGAAFREYPHNYGRCFYPCRDNFYDKATYTYIVTSQPGWRSLCSGVLQTADTNSDGSLTEVWQLNQPIPTYISSVSSAPWHIVETSFVGQNQSYPATLGFVGAQHDSAHVVAHFDMLNQVIPMFERCFGPYRWERIGYISTPMGSMEHAQNIALVTACMSTTGDMPCDMTTCHELAHAWFGNLVTCSTAGDMWINEGGASFCEEVAAQAIWDRHQADSYYQDKMSEVLRTTHSKDGGYLALSNMPEFYTYGSTSYDKGAVVWHSLRGVMGDSLFYSCMRRLFDRCAFGNLDAIALRDSLSLYSGLDLTDFFDFYVFNPGFVDYSIDLGVNGYEHIVTIRQLLKGTDRYPRSSRVPVTFISSNRTNRHKEWITVTDTLSEFRVTLPFSAARAIVDIDHEISDACTSDSASLLHKGVVEMPHAFCKVHLAEVPSTASWVHIGHHFAHPDGDTITGIVRMADRYWQVDGILYNPVTGLFLYNMGNNNSTGAAGIDIGFYERPSTLDSIWLLYRPDIHSPWGRVSQHRISSSTSSTGYFTYSLMSGQYTLAVCDTNLIPLAHIDTPSDKPSFSIYPNPTSTSFRIDMGGYSKKFDAVIFDMLGKKVLELRSLNDGDTIHHQLPAGTYIVVIKNNFLSLQSQIIVQ